MDFIQVQLASTSMTQQLVIQSEDESRFGAKQMCISLSDPSMSRLLRSIKVLNHGRIEHISWYVVCDVLYAVIACPSYFVFGVHTIIRVAHLYSCTIYAAHVKLNHTAARYVPHPSP
jgi:hypothetical protein